MREAAPKAFDRNMLRALMGWLNRHGPFWEDLRHHSGDDYLEYNDELVTDSAMGEAACCLIQGISRSLVSLKPSSYLISPLLVNWHDGCHVRTAEVANYWEPEAVEAALEAAPLQIGSWRDLEALARMRYPDLTFSDNSFDPLMGHPFGRSPAENLLLRLNVLHELKNGFNERGERTPEGHVLFQKHFTGDKAWFSDSSDSEKARFESELTFAHPARAGEWLFCTWHGKVKTPQLRVHFSWPIRAKDPLYIVYVGPKITRR